MSTIDRLTRSNEKPFLLHPSARIEVFQVTIRNLRKFATATRHGGLFVGNADHYVDAIRPSVPLRR